MANLTGAKGFGDARPAGWYPVLLEEVTPKTSNAGNLQYKVVASIREGDFMGGKFFDYLPLDPTVQGSLKTKKFLETFGKETEGDFDEDEVAGELVGLEAFVKVSRRMGKDMDGEPRMENRITAYASEDPGEPTPTKEDLEELETKEEGKVAERIEPAVAAKKNAAAARGKPNAKNGAATRARK